MNRNSKENISSNLMWRLFERFGAQGVSFVVSVVLARILDPALYGTIALVLVFTSIMEVFVDSGLGSALIQKKDADDLDFSTVFYFNLLFCLLLYFLLFLAAPLIAAFYRDQTLIPVLRVLGLTIVVSGLKNVQQAYVSRNMLFKRFFFSTLGGTIGAAFVGIGLAYLGAGVWALVAQHLFNLSIDTLILWFTVRWRPRKCFSLQRLKVLFSFGWKLLAAKLIDTVYEQIRSLIIGKKYSSADLAYYNRGKQFPAFAVTNINTAIDSVLFPSMSMEQDDPKKIRSMTARAIKTSSYVIFPMMVGMLVCAEPVVRLVLTDKWIFCVPYMRIFCIALALNPVLIANLNAIKAVGRSDIYLKLEIFRKVVGFATLLSLMWFGVTAIAVSYLLNCILNMFVNAYPNKHLLGYGYFEQVKDLLPSILASAGMGGIVFSLNFLIRQPLLLLALQIVTGVLAYWGISSLFHMESYGYLKSVLHSYREIARKGVKHEEV